MKVAAIILTLVSGLGASTGLAQKTEKVNEKPEILWIPTVGIYGSSFKANFNQVKVEGNGGISVGLDARIQTKRFFVQPGIHFFYSSIDVSRIGSNSATKDLRIISCKAPLTLGLYLTREDSRFFKFNIKGGGVANCLLMIGNVNHSPVTMENFNSFTYGVNAGIGLEFGPIIVDLTQEWGLTNYFKNNNEKNNLLRLSLGYKI